MKEVITKENRVTVVEHKEYCCDLCLYKSESKEYVAAHEKTHKIKPPVNIGDIRFYYLESKEDVEIVMKGFYGGYYHYTSSFKNPGWYGVETDEAGDNYDAFLRSVEDYMAEKQEELKDIWKFLYRVKVLLPEV